MKSISELFVEIKSKSEQILLKQPNSLLEAPLLSLEMSLLFLSSTS